MNDTDYDGGFYDINDIANILRITPKAIYNAILDGKSGDTIPNSVKIGRHRRWCKKSYRKWVDGLAG
jgi:predicted DNA-binding transcriptional regulator AlpA